MFKRRLQKWGVAKYATSNKMDRVVEILKRTNGRELTQPSPDKEMVVAGQKVTLSQVKRYLRRKKTSAASNGNKNDEFMRRWDDQSNQALRSSRFGQPDGSSAATELGSQDTEVDSVMGDDWFADFGLFDPKVEFRNVSASDAELKPLPADRTVTAGLRQHEVVLDPALWFRPPPTPLALDRNDWIDCNAIFGRTESRSMNFPPRHNHGHQSNGSENTHERFGGKWSLPTIEADDDEQSCSSSSKQRRHTDSTGSAFKNRFFACPYAKFDPVRFSGKNVHERQFRSCRTSLMRSIARVK
jgi:hypothetical protein